MAGKRTSLVLSRVKHVTRLRAREHCKYTRLLVQSLLLVSVCQSQTHAMPLHVTRSDPAHPRTVQPMRCLGPTLLTTPAQGTGNLPTRGAVLSATCTSCQYCLSELCLVHTCRCMSLGVSRLHDTHLQSLRSRRPAIERVRDTNHSLTCALEQPSTMSMPQWSSLSA